MSSSREPRPPAQPALIRLSALGDLIHSLPVWHMLRTLLGVPVPWVVQRQPAALLSLFLPPEEMVVVDLRQRHPARLGRELGRAREGLRRLGVDGLIDLQGLFKTAVLGRILGRPSWGMDRRDLREPHCGLFYHHRVPAYESPPGRQHVVWKNLHVASCALGLPTPDSVDFPPLPEALLERPGWLEGLEAPVVVNVGAAWETKRPAPRLLEALLLRLEAGPPTCLLWGTPQEEAVARQLAQRTGARLSPWLSFSDLVRLLVHARVLVTGDTLALHLADLVGTPSVGLFGPTDPDRNGSLHPQSLTLMPSVPCRGCQKRHCGRQLCMEGISIGRMEQAVRLLCEQVSRPPLQSLARTGRSYPGRGLGLSVSPLRRAP